MIRKESLTALDGKGGAESPTSKDKSRAEAKASLKDLLNWDVK